jgi:hypothetical protein
MMGGRHDRWSSCASAGKPNSCLRTWGEPLDRLIGSPMEMRTFLRLAVALSAALGGYTNVVSSTKTSSRPMCWLVPRPTRLSFLSSY